MSVPAELEEKLTQFDTALTNLEKILKPLVETNEKELNEKMEPLDNAKLEVFGAYTINSLFWMYLNVCGANPKEHRVKEELSRIQSYMKRIKEVPEKPTMKLDKAASKRFIKSALWENEQKPTESSELPQPSSSASAGDKDGSRKEAKKALWKSAKRKSSDRPSDISPAKK